MRFISLNPRTHEGEKNMNTSFKKQLLLGSAVVAIGALGATAAQAQTINDTSRPGAAVVAGGGLDFTGSQNDFAKAVVTSSGLTETTIDGGNDDNNEDTNTIDVYTTDTSGTPFTISGAVSITLDTSTATKTDTLVFSVGSSDAGTSDLNSSGITFQNSVDAGAQGTINITTYAGNADTITFEDNTVDLNDGVITMSEAADQVNFDGANTTFTAAHIKGGGIVDINGAAFATEAEIGDTTAVAAVQIADDTTATFQNDVHTDARRMARPVQLQLMVTLTVALLDTVC